jgi:hypothetical protein
MVAVYVPAATLLPAVKVRVLVVLVLEGSKVAVTPFGSPDTARATLLSKLLAPITVIVLLAVAPAASVRLMADVERLKEGAVSFALIEAASRFTSIVVLPDWMPELPFTFTSYCPGAADVFAVKVSRLVVEVLEGLNAAVTPFGRFDAESFTLPAEPF